MTKERCGRQLVISYPLPPKQNPLKQKISLTGLSTHLKLSNWLTASVVVIFAKKGTENARVQETYTQWKREKKEPKLWSDENLDPDKADIFRVRKQGQDDPRKDLGSEGHTFKGPLRWLKDIDSAYVDNVIDF